MDAPEPVRLRQVRAHRYLAEFQYRFNRRFDMKSILSRLLHALIVAFDIERIHRAVFKRGL